MQRAIDETNRRREVQRKYNEEHGVSPQTVTKVVRETIRSYDEAAPLTAQYGEEGLELVQLQQDGKPIRIEEIPILVAGLEKQMKDLAKAMEFEKAAVIRDEITALRKFLGTTDGRLGQDRRKSRTMSRHR